MDWRINNQLPDMQDWFSVSSVEQDGNDLDISSDALDILETAMKQIRDLYQQERDRDPTEPELTCLLDLVLAAPWND